jgi:ribonuclease R
MLAANQAVARHLTRLGLPMLYRIHEPPDPKKIEAFRIFVQGLGHAPPGTITRSPKGEAQKAANALHPKSFQTLLEHAKGSPHERLINHLLLRSMKQARYSTQNLGHFGLAFDCYTHFTSPIRRYPDLVVHRILKESLKAAAHRGKSPADLEAIAERSSDRERSSMEAEREAVKLKKRGLWQTKSEMSFPASSRAWPHSVSWSWRRILWRGWFQSRVSSMMITSISEKHCLLGKRHRRMLRLADPVNVRVERLI